MLLAAGALGMSALLPGSTTPASPEDVLPPASRARFRPTLVTTPAMIEQAKQAVSMNLEPFLRAWQAVNDDADAAMAREPAPYRGPDHIEYFRTARRGGWAARDLALAYHITGDLQYADRARMELAAWAAAADANVGGVKPHGVGLILGRVLPIFGDAYALLWDVLSIPERQAVAEWFRLMIKPVMTSRQIWQSGTYGEVGPPWLGRQYFNNHITSQTLAIATIGFTVGNSGLVRWAYDSERNPRDAKEVIAGAIFMPEDIGSGSEGDLWHRDPTLVNGAPRPEAGEIYDRHRMRDAVPRGLSYGLMHLELLTLLAELAYNNQYGSDLYRYVGPQGENLSVAFDYYADFLIAGDPAIKGGYYAREAQVSLNPVAIYQVAYRHYPENQRIRHVLERVDPLALDPEFFHRTGALTHGTQRG
jgi:hypothetical protein